MNLDQKELEKISEWFNKSKLTSATLEFNIDGSYKITLSREHLQVSQTKQQIQTQTVQEHSSEQNNVQQKSIQTKSDSKDPSIQVISSPIVGTFYRSPGPDSPPFVQVGNKVKKGDTLCIIEAMKVMNELEAEYDMEIVSVAIDNTQLVEYGQPLFEVRAL